LTVTENTDVLPDEQDFARIEGELFEKLERSHSRKARRHRLVIAASVVVLAGAGVAGVTQANGTAVNRAAYCYSAANTGSKSIQAQSAPDASNLTGAAQRARSAKLAVDTCGDAWNAGVLGSGTSIPPLQACIRNDQVVAVFPSSGAVAADAFCSNLGMSAP
jgi:hypothetical protein